jgi:RecA/RadA recombinase
MADTEDGVVAGTEEKDATSGKTKNQKGLITDANFDSVVDGLLKAVNLKAVNLQRGKFVENSISSGALALDLILGGGWPGGRWSVAFGPEGSGKSTLSFFAIAAAIRQKIPVFHFDYEGAADPTYMSRIKVKIDWLKEIAAKQRVFYRYLQPETGEQYFRFVHRMLKQLPDQNETIPAMLVVDSIPFMVPERRYDNDESSPMAQLAKMFSDNIPLIRSDLRAKNVAMYAVNQIRMRPGTNYGCLHADMPIRFCDGRVFTIKEIVDQKIGGDLWAHEDGKLVRRKINNWFNNGQSIPEDWVTIQTEGPGSGNGHYSVTVTKDHKVLTTRGWVKAKDVTLDDFLHTSHDTIDTGTDAVLAVAVTDIQHGLSARKARQLGKYDLEVEGCHNYLAGSSRGGLIVHNSPEYEPGGETPKFASDLRLRVSKRAIPQGKGPIEEEPCWDEKGTDRYVYAIMRTIKNRGFSPFRETWMRLWFEECGQPGRGIDPVYDTYQYLNMTGQLSERKGYYTVGVDGFKGDSRLTWQQFKALILDPAARKEPGTDLRKILRGQFASNEAFERYFGEFGGKLGERAAEEAEQAESKDLEQETVKAKEAEKGLVTQPKKGKKSKKSFDADDVKAE